MKPSEIKLTTKQKIMPFLKTLRDIIPWQALLIASVVIAFGWFVPPLVITFKATGTKLIAQRIMVGFFFSAIGFFLAGIVTMFFMDLLMNVKNALSKTYEKHALDKKKEVLDNIIEDEIL